MLLSTLGALGLAGTAWGAFVAEVAVDEGALVGTSDGFTVSVERMFLPADLDTDEGERRCIVEFLAGPDGQVDVALGTCPDDVADAVAGAAADWVLAVDGQAAEGERLMEVWLRFQRDPAELPHVFVRPSADTTWTVRAEGVDPLPYRVRQGAFAEYPEAARELDTHDGSCRVRTEVAIGGAPVVTGVEDCDDVFHEAAEAAVRRLRFREPKAGGLAMRSALDIGVDFFLAMEDGEVAPKATVRLPPETIGRERPQVDQGTVAPLQLPSGPPLLRFDEGPYAEVKVYGMTWPVLEPSPEERSCALVFQVSTRGEVQATPLQCSHPADLEAITTAAGRWRLAPGERRDGERYARFHGELVVPVEGEPFLRVEEGIVEEVHDDAAERLRTYARATARRRVPPKVPAGLPDDVPRGKAECGVQLTVTPKGRAEVTAIEGCDARLHPYVEKALKKWRWDPARADGQPLPTPAQVRMAFHVP